ncbi:hypothetical protein [Coleofasciculus sp. H7-2]
MKIFHPQRQKCRFLCLAISALLVLPIGVIPVRIAAHLQAPVPQAS